MSGDNLDALGQIAEGALLGAAVEPAHGGHATDERGDGTGCPNCGAAVNGNFCSNCGQKAHLHRTLTAFWHDLIHGALHFDGKLWRTLPLLAFKPGKLTRRYIDGERAKFVSPMALFLFSIFLMFAVFQMIGLTAPTQIPSSAGVTSGMTTLEDQMDAELEGLTGQLDDDDLAAERRTEIEARVAELEESRQKFVEARELIDERAVDTDNEMNVTGIDFIDEGIVKKWRENPSLMIYKLQANSYKFSWLLIPLSVPFVWLLFFWKRRFKAYDHAIFVTYSLSFMSLLFVVVSGLAFAGIHEAVIALSATFIPPLHMYKQLRRTYDLSRLGAFVRLNILLFFIVFVIVLFLQMLLVLGAF